MKNKWILIKKHIVWLVMVLMMDLFFYVLLWVADINAFRALSMILILTSLFLFIFISLIVVQHEKKYQQAFKEYILSPTEQNEEVLIGLSSDSDKEIIRLIGQTIKEKDSVIKELFTRNIDYEEYVESWAHEIKTPISLLTILLDNHSDEIPNNISVKLDYIRNKIQEYVEQILFYARLKSDKKDYVFEQIPLLEIMEDILEDYAPLLEEKNFIIRKEFLQTTVFSDKRSLKFLLSQIISNSIKYTKNDEIPELDIKYEVLDNRNSLIIKDNGIGVKSSDLPYIFEKGFTGDSGDNRKKATGMGLYLVKEIAGYLNLEMDVKSEWMSGLEVIIIFPKL